MSNPIRIGVIGCARILPAHFRGLKAIQDLGLADFRVTALCARRLDDAVMFRKRGEGPAPRPSVIKYAVTDPLNAPHMYVSDLHPDTLPDLYTDWREMLAADRVDAIINLTPVGLHHTSTLDCLLAGKHVIVEKPFAISVRAGQAMVDEARGRGLSLGVAEVVRYRESDRVMRWALDQGLIGSLQMWISGGMGSPDWSPDNIIAKTPWRHRKLEAGGGPAIDMGVHLFDRIRYLCGEVDEIGSVAPRFEAKRYTRDAEGQIIDSVDNEVEDAFFANLRFANGAVGTVFGGAAGHGEPTSLPDGSVIYGSKGCLKGTTVVLDGGQRLSAADLFAERADAALKERWFPRGLKDGFGLELLDFLRSIESGQPMETDGVEGLRDLACAFSLLESSTLRQPVRVADVLSGVVNAYQAEIDQHYGV
jgi:1,5-anhydro-D-fructose reductase (1,5-anhydro-D-mannitol-forming)